VGSKRRALSLTLGGPMMNVSGAEEGVTDVTWLHRPVRGKMLNTIQKSFAEATEGYGGTGGTAGRAKGSNCSGRAVQGGIAKKKK